MDNELDTREALRVFAEMLKSQMVYVLALHRNLVILYEVLGRDHPGLEKSHAAEMAKIRFFPQQQQQIENIDAIIHQLTKR